MISSNNLRVTYVQSHESTLQVLEDIGVRFADDEALHYLAEYKCNVDFEKQIVNRVMSVALSFVSWGLFNYLGLPSTCYRTKRRCPDSSVMFAYEFIMPGNNKLDLTVEKLPKNTVLLIIDVQKGFEEPVWGKRNNPEAETNIALLLEAWRKNNRPVVHVQHLSLEPNSPLRASQPGHEIKDAAKPQIGEQIFQKHVNSAFIGTDLERRLREQGYDTLVIVGLTTPHCVSTTARMSGNFGFHTFVVSDATAAFDMIGHDGRLYPAEEIHAVSLATLNGEFASVVETETILQAF